MNSSPPNRATVSSSSDVVRPRDRVAGPNASPEALRDLLEEAVAGGVPQRVVDPLEPVQVEEEDGRGSRAAGG